MSINAMHAKPDLRVLLKWMIAGSGSVIADVIRLKLTQTLFAPNILPNDDRIGNRHNHSHSITRRGNSWNSSLKTLSSWALVASFQ